MSLPRVKTFKLAGPDGDGKRSYLNARGAFLGDGVSLLEKDAFGLWRPRPQALLEKLFEIGYGVPVDLGSRMGGLEAVARALNEGDLCLASIALVQMALPELPNPCLAESMAKADGLGKVGFNPAEPRNYKGWWTAAGTTDEILARAKQNGGWLAPKDVHPGNEEECVSLVRAVVPGLPHSGAWREGTNITPATVNDIPVGTAIATFRDRSYHNTAKDHAAIYLGPDHQYNVDGIDVLEQWHGRNGKGYTQRGFYPYVRIPKKTS